MRIDKNESFRQKDVISKERYINFSIKFRKWFDQMWEYW